MQIDCFILGDFATNSYVVRNNSESRDCLIIDCGYKPDDLVAFLQENALKPGKIILTHGHCDHIAGIPEIWNYTGRIPVAISREDGSMLVNSRSNLSAFMGQPIKLDPADEELSEKELIEYDGLTFQVLPTPGHTPGGVSFYCPEEGVLFSGDTLFCGSVGRTDFPGGNMDVLIKSINEQLLVLPEDTRVMSGHGPETSIGQERRTNPYIL